MPRNLLNDELRLRIEIIAQVLREFGLVDNFGLSDLFRRKELPSNDIVVKCLRKSKDSLPISIPAKFIANSILERLRQPDPDTVAWAKAHKDLKCNLNKIQAGRKDATRYHRHIFELLKAIFEGILENGTIEQEVDKGLGFIDIIFDNSASEGFFAQLRRDYKIPCNYISFECKNYTGDLGNTEYNQLSNRLNEKRGRVGFLVCRSITDQKKSREQCKSRFSNKGEYILILEDDDIITLLDNRRKGDLQNLNRILLDKFREFFM